MRKLLLLLPLLLVGCVENDIEYIENNPRCVYIDFNKYTPTTETEDGVYCLQEIGE